MAGSPSLILLTITSPLGSRRASLSPLTPPLAVPPSYLVFSAFFSLFLTGAGDSDLDLFPDLSLDTTDTMVSSDFSYPHFI